MNWYVDFVTSYPLTSAMLQFALLGTFGDVISRWIIEKRFFSPYNFQTIIFKILEWAALAVMIKYAFIGFHGFVENLITNGYLPQLEGVAKSFTISLSMNLQFGPFLIIIHRLLDNFVIERVHKDSAWKNLDKSLYSLLWFWLPAHTITFLMPQEFQIGLAAVWSLALGIILGFFNRKK